HSAASDLYAATAMFFESVTGAPPYTGSELAGLSRAHQRAAVPAEAVPPVARPLVVAGLAKDPRDRPPAAAQFRRDLDVVARSVLGATWRDPARRRRADAGTQPGDVVADQRSDDQRRSGADAHRNSAADPCADSVHRAHVPHALSALTAGRGHSGGRNA